MKRKYRVWVEQINQQMYEVEATSKESAANKAAKLWKRENGASIRYIEEAK